MNNALVAKRIPGVEPSSLVLVDAFRHSSEPCQFWFLSHFHADHYQGLQSDWTAGVIHCSTITANLVVKIIGVDPSFVRPLPFDQEVELTDGLRVTLLDANHCPGASLLLFKVRNKAAEGGFAYHLHTGDMRYSERMKSYAALQNIRIDTVLLDTTYSHPRYEHMPQLDAMEAAASAVLQLLGGHAHKSDAAHEGEGGNGAEAGGAGKTLILLSAYKLGKERILMHVARRTGKKIYVDENKVRVLWCLGLSEEELGLFTTDMDATPLHVCRMGFCGDMWPYFRPNFINLQKYLDEHGVSRGYTHIHGIIPTGWADGSNWNKRNSLVSKGPCSVQLIPYSEHSNFPELFEFVKFLRPRSVLPTVFEDEKHRDAIARRFRQAVDQTANKRAFFAMWGGGKKAAGGVGKQDGDEEEDEDEIVLVREGKAEEEEGGQSQEGKDGAKKARLEPVERPESSAEKCIAIRNTQEVDTDDAEIEFVDSVHSKGGAEAGRAVNSRARVQAWSCKLCTYEHVGAEADRQDCAMCATARASPTQCKTEGVGREIGTGSSSIAGEQSSQSRATGEGAGGKGRKAGKQDKNGKGREGQGAGPAAASQQRTLFSYLGKKI